jgi:hypothetical protein
MDMLSLIENAENFKDLEKKVYEYFCNQACEFMKYILESMDYEIMLTRDKKRYRLKNTGRQGSITTLMGEVEYERRYYRCIDEDGVIYYGYLLDEWMGKDGKETLSENVKEAAVETALRVSFRKSEELIGLSNPYNISHQTIWNEVQRAGEKAIVLENKQVEKYLNGELKGDKEVPVLFEEKDGVYLSIKGKKNKQEIKVSKVYEGWQKKTPGSKEYTTINRFYVAGYEDGESFDARVNSKIAQRYNVDKIENKIVNADGATWAKQEQEYDASIIQQLDPFHIHQAVLRKMSNKNMAKKIRRYINKNNFEDVFIELEGLYDVEKNEKEKEKILELMTYLSQNVDHLERYTKRNLSLPEGVEYRGMGTIEGSQHNVICDRMKNRGMSWSTAGADKMAKLLCFKHSDGLEDVFETILPADKNTVVDINISEIIEKSQRESERSASKFLRDSKKSSVGYGCHFSPLPFTGVSVTNGRKAIQNMVRNNLLF